MQFLLTSHGAAASPSYPSSACMGKTVQAQARFAGLIHVNPCRDNDGKLASFQRRVCPSSAMCVLRGYTIGAGFHGNWFREPSAEEPG